MTTTGRTDPAFDGLRGSPALASAAADTLAPLRGERVAQRMAEWHHTLWRPDPTEIANRLGGLDLPDWMRTRLDGIRQLPGEGTPLMGLLALGEAARRPARVDGSGPGGAVTALRDGLA